MSKYIHTFVILLEVPMIKKQKKMNNTVASEYRKSLVKFLDKYNAVYDREKLSNLEDEAALLELYELMESIYLKNDNRIDRDGYLIMVEQFGYLRYFLVDFYLLKREVDYELYLSEKE